MVKLIIVQGPDMGKEFVIDEYAVVGRNKSNEIALMDESVSRYHARITKTNRGYTIQDLGSTNGVFINNRMVASQRIKDNDKIKVGNTTLIFKKTEGESTSITRAKPVEESLVELSSPEVETNAIVNAIDVDEWFESPPKSLTEIEVAKFNKRLKIVSDISKIIATSLDIDEILNKIVDGLFSIFKTAERAFIMLMDETAEELVPKVVKFKEGIPPDKIAVSKTIVGEVVDKRKAILSYDAMQDERFTQGQSILDMHIMSVMCAPFIANKKFLGIIYIDTTEAKGQFSEDDLSLLTSIGTQAALVIANAQMHAKILEQQRLEQDLRFATIVQHSFLPREVPQLEGYHFNAHYTPAYEVGGDFYDFINLPDERIGIVIGDVSGKGISAALLMAKITSELRFLSMTESEPKNLLTKINQNMIASTMDNRFITLIYMILDKNTGVVKFSNAGHLPPILRKASGGVESISEETCFPLALFDDSEYTQYEITLDSGDTLVLYTDGVIEAMNTDEKLYKLESLSYTIAQTQEPEALLDTIVTDVISFVQGAPQSDDMTMVIFGRQ